MKTDKKRNYGNEIMNIENAMIKDIYDFIGNGNTLNTNNDKYEDSFGRVLLLPDTYDNADVFRIDSLTANGDNNVVVETYNIEGGFEDTFNLDQLSVTEVLYIHDELGL